MSRIIGGPTIPPLMGAPVVGSATIVGRSQLVGQGLVLANAVREADLPAERLDALREQAVPGTATIDELAARNPDLAWFLRGLQQLGANMANIATIITLVLMIVSMRESDEHARRTEAAERRQIQLAEQQIQVEREMLAEQRAARHAGTGRLTDADVQRIADEVAKHIEADARRDK
jgi:hypothetical protein